MTDPSKFQANWPGSASIPPGTDSWRFCEHPAGGFQGFLEEAAGGRSEDGMQPYLIVSIIPSGVQTQTLSRPVSLAR